MDARVIRDGISGEPVTIKNPLMPEHIKVGTFLWYSGFTSTFRWTCPAVITRVGKNKRFRVRSLDDMKEQDQWYGADPETDSSGSRQTMRLTTPTEVAEYLDKQREALASRVEDARADLSSAESAIAYFDTVRVTLELN